MEKNIWQHCRGVDHLISLNLHAWRMVESQLKTSTRKLVDSLEEYDLLEELIESYKPPLKKDSLGLHYLLSTPFRYPPLKNGSRFGTRFEPSFWYGSQKINTAMAETAYYRFNFIRASHAEFGNVITNHTAFIAHVKTKRGIDLTETPFSKFTSLISSPSSYTESQILGKMMREDKVEMFYYQSARDPNKHKNIALITPKAFSQKTPNKNSFQSWQCIINRNNADFIRLASIVDERQSFPIELFISNGKLPFPAD